MFCMKNTECLKNVNTICNNMQIYILNTPNIPGY